MTCKLLFALCLSWLFSACSKENDFIQPAGRSFQPLSFEMIGGSPKTTGMSPMIDSCIDVTSTHWLKGTGVFKPVPVLAHQEIYGGSAPPRRYVIEASGDVMSELYARGYSVLNLIYHTRSHQMTGSLITQFYYGEVLELILEGEAHADYIGQKINLKLIIKDATFRSGTEILEFYQGTINFVLPILPEGELKVDIISNTTLCIP